MKTAIHWFRRDLRLTDNTALHAASLAAERVIPLFILDPVEQERRKAGVAQARLLASAIASLQVDIREAGGELCLRTGSFQDEMDEVIRITGATEVFCNREYDPQARVRDQEMSAHLGARGIKLHMLSDSVLVEPEKVLKPDGTPYKVFTPYRKAWTLQSLLEPLPPVKFTHLGGELPALFQAQDHLDDVRSGPAPLPIGEKIARQQLADFIERAALNYATLRNIPGLEGTSRLSPHLTLGTISPRTVLAAVNEAGSRHPEAKADLEVFRSELTWRDFYRQILWHFPHVAESAFKPETNDLKWENDERLFTAWKEGRTGYPIVDAGMRQLNTTGWMHNRVRMIVAAFLTKDLLVSWQWGERYFMEKLYDADLAANNGGWQWSASTGTDAQPYFRIFNPIEQARKFDPEGKYIATYVPEAMTRDYPAPIVDHRVQREKALAMFQRIRG